LPIKPVLPTGHPFRILLQLESSDMAIGVGSDAGQKKVAKGDGEEASEACATSLLHELVWEMARE